MSIFHLAQAPDAISKLGLGQQVVVAEFIEPALAE
jgi:hypothetical protein